MSTQTAHSEDFTPAELAYFSSKGNDTAGLEAETTQDGAGAPPGAGPEQIEGQPSPEQTAASDDPEAVGDDGDEEVVIVGKDGKPRNQNGRFVPHQALHKERERRKTVETELMTTREKMARADERLAVLNEILTQSGDPAPAAGRQDEQPIDPNQDPVGALSQALTKIKSLEQQISERERQSTERESERAMRTAYQNDAVRYLTEKPEFKDAYRFLIEGRHRELEAMGMSDANERNRFIANEERQLVATAFQNRRSPSQMLHQLATARGFKFEAPAQQQQTAPAQKIEQIAKGQRTAGVSLSGAGGSAGEGLTASALADMSEEEFATVAAKLGKSKLRQLMGG